VTSSRLLACLPALVLALAGCAVPADDDDRSRPGRQEARARAERDVVPARDRTRSSGERSRGQDQDQDRERAGPARTYLVTHVVDGDTVDLANGERVRLVGIDTPEVGECGYEQSSQALARLVLDRQVALVVSDEDRDGYGRLLRYVDVGGVDAGLQLVRDGLAVARYDSRDGYGFHPREPQYVAADRGSRPPSCARPRGFAGVPAAPAAAGCAPGYSPCVPPGPPDLDCADVGGPVRVAGSDPHRLDGDGDGTACE
jgi:endonuclease YncB( thermonuclease family)